MSMFADDCIIFQSGNTWEIVRENLQSDLDNVLTWMSENSLMLNGSKTQAMILGPKGKLQRLNVQKPILILDKPVKFVKQYNYLGIYLDSEMTLKPILKHVKKLLTNKIFGKIRKFLTEKAALSVYKETVLPTLNYAVFFYYYPVMSVTVLISRKFKMIFFSYVIR